MEMGLENWFSSSHLALLLFSQYNSNYIRKGKFGCEEEWNKQTKKQTKLKYEIKKVWI